MSQFAFAAHSHRFVHYRRREKRSVRKIVAFERKWKDYLWIAAKPAHISRKLYRVLFYGDQYSDEWITDLVERAKSEELCSDNVEWVLWYIWATRNRPFRC